MKSSVYQASISKHGYSLRYNSTGTIYKLEGQINHLTCMSAFNALVQGKPPDPPRFSLLCLT